MAEKTSIAVRLNWRRAAQALGGLLLLMLILAAAVLIYFDTGSGQRKLVTWLNSSLDRGADGGVTLGRIEGSLYDRFTLSSVKIADRKGVWLELDAIAVDWSPLDLMSGRLRISEMALQRARIHRTPVGDSTESPPADDLIVLPSLPVDIHVAAYDIATIALGRDIISTKARFKSRGAFRLTRADGINITAQLINKGPQQDVVTADISYPGDDETLTADIEVQAPKGGIFARLIGIQSTEDAFATLKGSGPLDDWSGKFVAHVGDTRIADAAIRREGEALSIRGQLDAGDYISESEAALLGRSASLAFYLAPTEDGARTDLSFNLEADTIKFSAHGALAKENAALSEAIDFSLEITDARPFNKMLSPSHIGPFKIEGTVTNLATTPEINAAFDNVTFGYRAGENTPNDHEESVAEADAADFQATLHGRITAAATPSEFTLSAAGRMERITGHSVTSVAPLIKPGFAWAVAGSADRTTSDISFDRISLKNDLLSGVAKGNFSRETGALAVTMEALLTGISPLLPDLSGGITLTADVNRENTASPLRANVVATGRGLHLPDEMARQIVGETPRFAASVTVMPDGHINIEKASLRGQHLSANAAVSLTPAETLTDGRYQLTFSNLDKLQGLEGLDLDGNVTISGALSGPLASPSLSMKSDLDSLRLQNITFRNVAARARADNILTNLRGIVTLESDSNHGPLTATAEFAADRQDGEAPALYRISGLEIALGGYRAAGAVTLPPGRPLTGKITVTTTESDTDSARLFRGDVTAEIDLAAQDNRQRITLQADLGDLAYTTAGGDVATLEKGSLSATVLLRKELPAMMLEAKFTELMHPLIQAREGQVTIEQEPEGLRYRIQATGTGLMPYDLTATGSVAPSDESESRKITIELDGAIAETAIQTRAPLVITLGQADFAVAPFDITLGDGHIQGEMARRPAGITADITADKADLRPLTLFAPDMPLTGILSGKLSLNVTETTTEGTLDARLTALQIGRTNTLNADLGLRLEGTLTPEGAGFTALGQLGDQMEARMTGEVPLRITGAGTAISLPRDEPIKGEIVWTGAVAPLWPAFNLNNHDLSGEIDASFQIDGTLDAPNIAGGLRLKGGRYEMLHTGFVATDLDMAATIADRKLKLDHLTAGDGNGGRIQATGDFTLHPDLSYDMTAAIDVKQAQIVRQPQLDIKATTQLEFVKNDRESRLSGDIAVDEANIGNVTQGDGAIVEVDVTEINAPVEDASREVGFATAQPDPVDLRLALRAPNRIFIRTHGLNSEWRTDLTIRGTSEAPIVDGTVTLVRGFYEFAGKRFDLTRGKLEFPGTKRNDPRIDITAEHELTDMTAYLNISGPASAPKLTVTSSPGLPEDEVLSRILFGTRPTELSAMEAIQLAEALRSLSSGSGGPGLIGGVRSALGIDRLTIDKVEGRDYGTTITGGKYLTENVYVEVTTAPATGETATSVEVTLTDSLSLVTRRTLDHGNSLALRWSWKY